MKSVIFVLLFLSSIVYGQQQLETNWNWIHNNGVDENGILVNQSSITFNGSGYTYLIQIANPMHDAVHCTYGQATIIIKPDEVIFWMTSDTPIKIISPHGVLLYRIIQMFKN